MPKQKKVGIEEYIPSGFYRQAFPKLYMVFKTGYSLGVYGCSGEYFIAILINGENVISFVFHGMYGTETRIMHHIESFGYQWRNVRCDWGKLTRSDVSCFNLSEYQAIDYITKLCTPKI